MPRVAHPALAVRVGEEEAKKALRRALLAKGHPRVETGKAILVLRPFLVLDAEYVEADGEGRVEAVRHARFALNACTRAVENGFLEEYDEEALVHRLPEGIRPRVHRARVAARHALTVALPRLSKALGVPRQDIQVLEARLVYHPRWEVEAATEGAHVQAEVSAVTGRVLDEDGLPAREPPFNEVAAEAAADLARPRAWAAHLAGVASDAAALVAGFLARVSRARILYYLGDWRVQTLLLLLLLLAVLAYEPPAPA